MRKEYAYSFNESDWHAEGFETIEETLAAAFKYDKAEICVFIGEVVRGFVPIIDADDIIEQAIMQADEDGGEWADGYMDDVTNERKQELEEELNRVFEKWLEKYNINPYWFTVEDIETYRNTGRVK